LYPRLSASQALASLKGGEVILIKGRYPISAMVAGRVKKGFARLISGNPLMGQSVDGEDFLGFDDTVFCVIPENVKRQFLHFFRLGMEKYTFSKTYLSGHLDNSQREYPFTTVSTGNTAHSLIARYMMR